MSACCENYPDCSHVLADRYIREGNALAAKNRELAELQAKLRAVTATASKAEADNERLRAALTDIADRTSAQWVERLARAALEGSK